MVKKCISVKSCGFLLLKQMYNVSSMWKKDAMLYLNSLTQENAASNIYKKLFDCGFIEEYESISPKELKVSNEFKKTDVFNRINQEKPQRGDYIVVNITKEGINYLLDNADKSEYISTQESEFFYKNIKSTHRRFRTTDSKKYLRELENNHVKNFISTTGTKVFPSEKPSLLNLYLDLKSNSSIKSNRKYFYSLQEFREFDKSYCKLNNMPLGEEYRSSTASGIFISDKRCLIIYLSEPSTNKLVYLSNSEDILIAKINHYFSDLFDYGKYVIHINGKNIKSSIEALVLCDSNSLIYSMSSGKKHARFYYQENKDLTKLYTPKKLLLHDNELFSNIYCIPTTRTGLKSLDYLLSHSIKEYDLDCCNQVKEHQDIFCYTNQRGDYFSYGYKKMNSNSSYKYPNLKRIVIFMPVADINLLFRLSLRNDINSDYYERYAFVTYPDMVGAISHSIRKDGCIYYDIEDSVLYMLKENEEIHEVLAKKQIYFLPSRNKHVCLTSDEYEAIQKICSFHLLQEQEEYWKQSELDDYMRAFYQNKNMNLSCLIRDCEESKNEMKHSLPIEVISYNYYGYKTIDEVPKKEKPRKQHKKLTKSNRLSIVSFDESKILMIKKAARCKNFSISKYVLEIVYKQATIDIQEYEEDKKESLKQMRRRYSV